MKKAPNGHFLWDAFALSLAALLAAGQSKPTRTAAELNHLQGYWEGEGAGGKCSITITGNSVHYRAGTTWYEATFVLPANTDPQQLHATIKDCGPRKETIGKVVFVIYKIEDGTLTLTTYDPSDEPPKTFNSANLYVVKKVERCRQFPTLASPVYTVHFLGALGVSAVRTVLASSGAKVSGGPPTFRCAAGRSVGPTSQRSEPGPALRGDHHSQYDRSV